jgi:hypothetical protein
VRSWTARTWRAGRVGSLVVLALLASIVLDACGGASGLRAPTRAERAQMIAAVDKDWAFYADFGSPCCHPEIGFSAPDFQQLHYQPHIVSIRVSKRDPRLAVAAVEVFTASGQPTHHAAVAMLVKQRRVESGEPGWVAGGARTRFALSCVPSVARAVRELLCPSPWAVLDDSAGAPVQSKAASVGAIAPRWSEVGLPGSVCGATTPIHLHWNRSWGRAYVRSTYWPWYPVVEVDASRPHLGESLGYEGAELGDHYTHYGYMHVECSNGGGMGPDTLAWSVVVFATGEHEEGEPEYPLRVVGVITPQQPYAGVGPADIGEVELTRNIAVTRHGQTTLRGLVIVSEGWHGPADSPDFPTGRATTIWTYSHGKLVSPRTVVDLAPQPSRP